MIVFQTALYAVICKFAVFKYSYTFAIGSKPYFATCVFINIVDVVIANIIYIVIVCKTVFFSNVFIFFVYVEDHGHALKPACTNGIATPGY